MTGVRAPRLLSRDPLLQEKRDDDQRRGPFGRRASAGDRPPRHASRPMVMLPSPWQPRRVEIARPAPMFARHTCRNVLGMIVNRLNFCENEWARSMPRNEGPHPVAESACTENVRFGACSTRDVARPHRGL